MRPFYLLTAWARPFCIGASLLISSFSFSQENMRANLYAVPASGSPTLMDGNFTNYDNIYSNAVDWDDAWKMTNPGENFSIYRENVNLVVERRQLIGLTDTTFFKMWNMQQRNYLLQIITSNMNSPELHASLLDTYTNTTIPVQLNDTTVIPFTVNSNPGSSNPLRFKLIYITGTTGTLPVNFTGIIATKKTGGNQVSWTVDNEVSIDHYELETSADGSHFKSIHNEGCSNVSVRTTYQYLDPEAASGPQFYRVKALSRNGYVQYSAIVKLWSAAITGDLQVYPNAITDNFLNIYTNGIPSGTYAALIIGSNGQVIFQSHLNISATTGKYTVKIPSNTVKGICTLVLNGKGRYTSKIYVK